MNNNLDLSAIPYVRLTKIDSRLLGIFNRILDLPGGGFFICKNGELTIGSNEKFYTLRKGDLYVFPADTKLYLKNWSEDIIGISGIADTDFIIPVLSRVLDADMLLYLLKNQCTSLTDEQVARIEELVIILYDRERMPPSPVQKRLCQSLGLALYYEIILALWSNIRKPPAVATRKDQVLLQFLADIRENVTQHKDVQFYAALRNLSPKYFSLMIKECSGLHAREWIALALVNAAKSALLSSQQSVKEISYALGFPNQSAFGRFFRTNTGMSPQRFRTIKTK